MPSWTDTLRGMEPAVETGLGIEYCTSVLLAPEWAIVLDRDDQRPMEYLGSEALMTACQCRDLEPARREPSISVSH